ncbi:MAG: aspartyl-phosphate phosphatase Spo0E family protein [Clostridiales bacterium]
MEYTRKQMIEAYQNGDMDCTLTYSRQLDIYLNEYDLDSNIYWQLVDELSSEDLISA